MRPLSTVWSCWITALLLSLLAFSVWRLWRAVREFPSRRHRRLHANVAFALSFFVLYDVCVYNLLVYHLPYTPSPVGAGRFILDFVMAFCILLLLWTGMSVDVWSAGLRLVGLLILWHLLAVTWHFM